MMSPVSPTAPQPPRNRRGRTSRGWEGLQGLKRGPCLWPHAPLPGAGCRPWSGRAGAQAPGAGRPGWVRWRGPTPAPGLGGNGGAASPIAHGHWGAIYRPLCSSGSQAGAGNQLPAPSGRRVGPRNQEAGPCPHPPGLSLQACPSGPLQSAGPPPPGSLQGPAWPPRAPVPESERLWRPPRLPQEEAWRSSATPRSRWAGWPPSAPARQVGEWAGQAPGLADPAAEEACAGARGSPALGLRRARETAGAGAWTLSAQGPPCPPRGLGLPRRNWLCACTRLPTQEAPRREDPRSSGLAGSPPPPGPCAPGPAHWAFFPTGSRGSLSDSRLHSFAWPGPTRMRPLPPPVW